MCPSGCCRGLLLCGYYVWLSVLSHSAHADDFYLLSGDRSAFEARVELITRAQCQIEMAYYAIDSGEVALTLINHLRDAAKRGVKVRILVDGLKSRLPATFEELLMQERVELHVYHPPLKLHPEWLNRRIHYKLLIADRQAMIVGSRNLEDSHFGLAEENFVDTDALLTGNICQLASDHFETLWNSDEVFPVDESLSWGLNFLDNIELKVPRVVVASILEEGFTNERHECCASLPSSTKATCVSGSPLKRFRRSLVEKRMDAYELRSRQAAERLSCRDDFRDHPDTACSDPLVENIRCSVLIHDQIDKSKRCFQAQVIKIIDASRESLWIETPYPVLEDPIFDALHRAIQRGVKITLFTNSLGSIDRSAPYAAFQNDKRIYRKMGVEIIEYTGEDALHAKSILIDDQSALIGSYNMDARSDRLNLEIGFWIQDERVCRVLKQQMQKRMQHAQATRLNDSWIPRVVRGDASLLKYSRMRFRQLFVPLIRSSL